MINKSLAPVCGLYCGDCEYLGNPCKGCGNEEGKPFWTSQAGMDVCPIHDCCANKKSLEHCGLCDELPCEAFLSLRDPALSDEEFNASLQKRQAALSRRKEIGTDKWLEEMTGG
jgi:hypothetical protein